MYTKFRLATDLPERNYRGLSVITQAIEGQCGVHISQSLSYSPQYKCKYTSNA